MTALLWTLGVMAVWLGIGAIVGRWAYTVTYRVHVKEGDTLKDDAAFRKDAHDGAMISLFFFPVGLVGATILWFKLHNGKGSWFSRTIDREKAEAAREREEAERLRAAEAEAKRAEDEVLSWTPPKGAA